MDNHNIITDRQRLTSNEIEQHKDFDGVLNDYRIMKKPFYKNPWFFGVTGVASVGLLIGANYSFADNPPEPMLSIVSKEPVLKKDSKTIYLASLETNHVQEHSSAPEQTQHIPVKKKEIYDKTATLKNNNKKSSTEESGKLPSEKDLARAKVSEKLEEPIPMVSNALQNHPKIQGRIGGVLKIKSVSEKTTLKTDSDIPIDGFEMHIATEFGAKVFRSSTNRLTKEMVNAIRGADFNTEVYFESISGNIGSGKRLNLSPMKFTLVR